MVKERRQEKLVEIKGVKLNPFQKDMITPRPDDNDELYTSIIALLNQLLFLSE